MKDFLESIADEISEKGRSTYSRKKKTSGEPDLKGDRIPEPGDDEKTKKKVKESDSDADTYADGSENDPVVNAAQRILDYINTQTESLDDDQYAEFVGTLCDALTEEE